MFQRRSPALWAGYRALRLATLSGLVAFLLTGAAHATCKGTDILPKLAASHPEVMQQVRAESDKIINARAILWRIEKPGGAPSHLFGTMHVSDPRVMAMPAAARTAIETSRTVALEIADISPGAMLKAVSKVPQLMVYVDGSRLDQKLTQAEFKQVSGLLSKAGMPAEMAAIVRPWMISMVLAIPLCEQQRVANGGTALDAAIGALAKKSNVPVVGLETVESQLTSLSGVPEADQMAMLRLSLAFLAQREDMFETLIQAYVKRDLGVVLALSKGLAQIAGLKSSGFASFSRELIAKRNHSMFASSRPLVDQGNAFIAVGAAHLIGATGLVALYRKAGFTVTAIE
ncbi:MAG: TraB/GumN family protein [Hyphomicrobiaceae bacterium]